MYIIWKITAFNAPKNIKIQEVCLWRYRNPITWLHKVEIVAHADSIFCLFVFLFVLSELSLESCTIFAARPRPTAHRAALMVRVLSRHGDGMWQQHRPSGMTITRHLAICLLQFIYFLYWHVCTSPQRQNKSCCDARSVQNHKTAWNIMYSKK